MSENKINRILKHKRIIIIGLLALGLIILIMLTYILTYASNKPKPFSKDTNVKFTNKCEYFDLDLEAETVCLKSTSQDKSNIQFRATIKNLKTKLTDTKISFEVHSHWTTKTEVTETSLTSFNNGGTLTTSSEWTVEPKVSLNVNYPVRVLPLVSVKKPTIYAKVTYTRISVSNEKITESVYYKLTYSQYVNKNTVFK